MDKRIKKMSYKILFEIAFIIVIVCCISLISLITEVGKNPIHYFYTVFSHGSSKKITDSFAISKTLLIENCYTIHLLYSIV